MKKLSESRWTDIQKRSSGDELRKEQGDILGQTEDGERIVIGTSAGTDGSVTVTSETITPTFNSTEKTPSVTFTVNP